MFETSQARIVAAVAALGWGGLVYAGDAPSGEPTPAELREQIRALQEQVNRLESRAATAPATAPTARDVDSTVQQVIRDADARSHFLATDSTLTGGYDKGFFLKSADGDFLLKPGIQAQFRNVTNYREEQPADPDSDIENGFEIRRFRLRFEGNVFNPDLTYLVQFDVNRNGGDTSLLDAWAQWRFAEQWAVRGGQFKESWAHERDLSGFNQLAVDRSILDGLLGGGLTDRVQGVSLIYGGVKDNPIRTEVALHDGANSRNTNFTDGSTYFGAGGRAEYKLFGDWASYKDFTAKGSKENLFVLGAGAEFTDRAGTATAGGVGDLLGTVDAQYEHTNGLSLYGAVHARLQNLRGTAAGAEDERTDVGGLVQVGYLLNPKWEVFGRAAYAQLDDDFVAEDDYSEYTTGVNYYLGDDGAYLHKAKVTVDVGYLPDGAPADNTSIGVLASPDAEFVLRAQFQLIL